MLGELFPVGLDNRGKVPILGAPPEIILDNSDHLIDALCLI